MIGEDGGGIRRAKECGRRRSWGCRRRRESRIGISEMIEITVGNNGRSKEKEVMREMGKQSRGGEGIL